MSHIEFTKVNHSSELKFSDYDIAEGMNLLFNYGGFWYYNNSIYPDSYDSPLSVDDIDIEKRVLDNDVIIIMSTDANLKDLGWGFIESLDSLMLK